MRGSPWYLVLPLAISTLGAACISATPTGTPRPTRTPNIERTELDLVYTAFVSGDVHKVTSKTALDGALDAVRAEVKAAGSGATVTTPSFQDVSDPQIADFKKFADAVSALASRTPDLAPQLIARAAITGMIRTSPDCHTYFFDGRSRIDSRPVHPTGDPRPAPPPGKVLQQPDQAGLTARILPGGVAYVRWTRFEIDGTYDIRATLKAVLDKALAAGAKAWLFDLRGNIGGNGADVIGSWFLNGEPVMRIVEKVGQPTISDANKDLRLPRQYQLPIALIQNDQGGSDPEILALYLKESKRGTIVGGRSIGCVGAAEPTTLPDGSEFYVAVQEYSGATTGARYDNLGIPPDVPSTDAEAVQVATRVLQIQEMPSPYDSPTPDRTHFLSWARVYVPESEYRQALADEAAHRVHSWSFLADPRSRTDPRFAGFYAP